MSFFDHSESIVPETNMKADEGKIDQQTIGAYNKLYRDLKQDVLQSFLTAKEATLMRGVNKESLTFFGTEHEKRLKALGVKDEQIASINPPTQTAIRIVTHQLEEIKRNSPSAFKTFKQNYLDTGISCPAAFSLEFDVRTVLKYLANSERGPLITLVTAEDLAKACGTGNLSMVQWMLDPVNVVMGRPGSLTGPTPTHMIIIAKNFLMMKWVMEQTIAAKSPQTVEIAKKMPLAFNIIFDAAILGGKEVYEKMASVVREHRNKLPAMAASLPLADYFSGIVNDQHLDDFEWISNLHDPRLLNDGLGLIQALYISNNVQLLNKFFNKVVSYANQGIVLTETFTDHPTIFLELALKVGCDIDMLTITYQKFREEQRLLYVNEIQAADEQEQAFQLYFTNAIEKSCMSALIRSGDNLYLLPAQLSALHIKPTLQHVVEATNNKAYATAKMLTSDLMGDNKVLVTRSSLQAGFERLNYTKPSDEILAKLFNIQSAALDQDRDQEQSSVKLEA